MKLLITFILVLFTAGVNAQQPHGPDTFSFQKVFYERSGGGMIRVDYSHVQFTVDSSGWLIFSCIPEKGTMNGTYSGQLSPAQLAQLIALVKKCDPERFTINPQKVPDVPGHAFRFYYNNKMTEGRGQMIPRAAGDLADFLESLTASVKLQRITLNYGVGK